MNSKRTIKKWLSREILLLDGAIGTELQERGLPTGVSPEAWCLDNQAILAEIHRAYSRAGSRVVYTATFGANPFKLKQYNLDRTREINRELAALARRSVKQGTLVGGSIGPTGLMVEPFGPLPFEEAVAAFKEQIRGLLAGGVDLFALETMIDIQEARAALLAVKELCNHYTVVTMTLEKNGRTLGGTDPVTALITLQALGADAVGCNCSAGPETMAGFIAAMKPYATVPLAAKPNAGMPILTDDGRTIFPMDPPEFSLLAGKIIAAGVNILGGCCGTNPEHIRALRDRLTGVVPIAPRKTSLGAVSSGRAHRIIELDRPLLIIGERINPTGKKDLQEELRAGKVSLIRKLAREQESAGADLLDVNVGVPGLDEAQAMKKAVAGITMAASLPLVIDSACPQAIEAALRLYPGRALINSISLEKSRIEEILPLAARYGAMIIILPLTGEGIPEQAAARKAIVREIFKRAKAWGYTKADIVVDALVMTAATNPELAAEALQVVSWCHDTFRCPSLLGLTNISFGMPGRAWLNSAYLAMAQPRGLTIAIANPASVELMQIKLAGDVLTNRDRKAQNYIARFTGRGGEAREAAPNLRHQEKIFKAILEGNKEEILPLLEDALAAGVSAMELMHQVMMKAIARVGELFEEKVYFLPQLIASAETMKTGIGRIEGLLTPEAGSASSCGTIILATVRGDIHDIGKNIVALLLKNSGHRVIDLGKNVAPDVITAAIREHQPDLVGLSALMTTTMMGMKDVIERVRGEGLSCRFILGGAVVTPGFAQSLGALFARDGVEAARIMARVLEEKVSRK